MFDDLRVMSYGWYYLLDHVFFCLLVVIYN